MDISAGSLVLRAVKLTYDFWKDARTDALALSEDAKDVLGRMQTDPTDNGVFVDATGLGDSHIGRPGYPPPVWTGDDPQDLGRPGQRHE